MLVMLGENLSDNFKEYFNILAQQPQPGIEIIPSIMAKYKSDEPYVDVYPGDPEHIDENLQKLKGQDVTIIQSTSGNVSESIVKLMLSIYNLKDLGAARVTVAMPFAALGQQDRRFAGRGSSVACDHMARMLKSAGAEGVILYELHSCAGLQFYKDQFGEDNVVNLSSAEIFAEHAAQNIQGPVQITAPDGADKPGDNGQKRAAALNTAYASRMGIAPQPLGQITKVHNSDNDTAVKTTILDMKDKTAVIVDDLGGTWGTLGNGAEVCKNNGARQAFGYISHAMSKTPALIKLFERRTQDDQPVIDRLIVTDTVPGFAAVWEEARKSLPGNTDNLVTTLHTAPLFAKAILNL